MKHILKTILITTMLVCATGCGNADTNENTSATNTPVPTQTVAPTKEASNNTVNNDAEVVVNEGEFKIGQYAGTATYASGEFSMIWNFVLNYYEDGKFILMNDAGEEKGVGTYALTDNCYTMTYDDNRSCTFVVQKDGTLNVTEALPYGQATIDPEKVGELVLSYIGEASASSYEKETTSKEEENTTATGNFAISAGTYNASYIKESAMAGTVEYIYSAEIGADGTFSYKVRFDMGNTTYDGSTANGTYIIDGNKFVFTDSEGTVTEGTLIAENTLVISLMASAMAKEPYEVTFVIQ